MTPTSVSTARTDNAAHIDVAALMARSGVTFGTSGARGLVSAMTDELCFIYAAAFIDYMTETGALDGDRNRVAIAGDLRDSTDRIMRAVARAVTDRGYEVVNCGKITTPALACHAMQNAMPCIMVTGSHIPEDRNGMKFYTPDGEILKADEAAIRARGVAHDPALLTETGMFANPVELPEVDGAAYDGYIARYVDFFEAGRLNGLRIGLYEHSGVAREAVAEILTALGAEVVKLGRATGGFVPVDTEAVRDEDARLARQWAAEHELDAVVSTDGDGDRPLVSDEHGAWLRGDIAGMLCARYLGVDTVVTPVSSNTAVELCGAFRDVRRTRIGSPYVIAEMADVLNDDAVVAGYEANGGFLLASDVAKDGRVLTALPTRDAVIVMLAILAEAKERGVPVSHICADLPQRYTASGLVRDFMPEDSAAKLEALDTHDAIEAAFDGAFGKVLKTDRTDGLRVTFECGEIAHLRPSGNAPEFRCYNEADSEARAWKLNREFITIMQRWRDGD